MRELCILILLLVTIACGVAIHGRIDVGRDDGKPRTESPCPQGNP